MSEGEVWWEAAQPLGFPVPCAIRPNTANIYPLHNTPPDTTHMPTIIAMKYPCPLTVGYCERTTIKAKRGTLAHTGRPQSCEEPRLMAVSGPQ
ncbi:hypothetical protein E2C01_006564 [Portunus trituberculatus]|uniref:Uncharacterized protein n=1 Tax=Portunus trituberculatus TaxID=210409 RepID=A0A5B7CVE3_PORTR|nr:hypothetical protein [Portunus trituberculatus]